MISQAGIFVWGESEKKNLVKEAKIYNQESSRTSWDNQRAR